MKLGIEYFAAPLIQIQKIYQRITGVKGVKIINKSIHEADSTETGENFTC